MITKSKSYNTVPVTFSYTPLMKSHFQPLSGQILSPSYIICVSSGITFCTKLLVSWRISWGRLFFNLIQTSLFLTQMLTQLCFLISCNAEWDVFERFLKWKRSLCLTHLFVHFPYYLYIIHIYYLVCYVFFSPSLMWRSGLQLPASLCLHICWGDDCPGSSCGVSWAETGSVQ